MGFLHRARQGTIVVFAICAFVYANTSAVSAQPAGTSQSALAVSPAILENVVHPGQPKVVTVKVSNITNFPLPISSAVKSFTPLENIDDAKAHSKFDASKWFVVTDPDFILQPKETNTVSITITAPAGAEPGGHYATVYFTPLIPETALTPSTAYLSAQVGSLAFLIVPGNITEKLSLTNFTTARVHQSRSIDIQVQLANSGNVHLAPNGFIEIQNWRGKSLARLPLQAGIVLPDIAKTITTHWHAPSLIGKYSATFHMTYGSQTNTIPSRTVVFWIIPWGTLLTILIPLVLIIVIVIRTRGRWKLAMHLLLRS